MSLAVTGINIQQELDRVKEFWKPLVVGRVNNQLIKVAKLSGEFVWHAHQHEDEMFMVVDGLLRIQLEGQELVLKAGDFCVIPRAVRHCPIAEGVCCVMLIEPDTTLHTGGVISKLTVSVSEQMQP